MIIENSTGGILQPCRGLPSRLDNVLKYSGFPLGSDKLAFQNNILKKSQLLNDASSRPKLDSHHSPVNNIKSNENMVGLERLWVI